MAADSSALNEEKRLFFVVTSLWPEDAGGDCASLSLSLGTFYTPSSLSGEAFLHEKFSFLLLGKQLARDKVEKKGD